MEKVYVIKWVSEKGRDEYHSTHKFHPLSEDLARIRITAPGTEEFDEEWHGEWGQEEHLHLEFEGKRYYCDLYPLRIGWVLVRGDDDALTLEQGEVGA